MSVDRRQKMVATSIPLFFSPSLPCGLLQKEIPETRDGMDTSKSVILHFDLHHNATSLFRTEYTPVPENHTKVERGCVIKGIAPWFNIQC